MTSPEGERAGWSVKFEGDFMSRLELLASQFSKVGWEALESSSAVLQTAAKPSQLPTRVLS